ncbi:MAG: nuclear transport factor 2 family protein [Bacteroidetes bacterium]|nr:nuclear transport factor 2 family protein [Bacteroidota bacterium]MBS1540339.1 nuclear transport factor 2 family protein [Bacteroidota bacterium]
MTNEQLISHFYASFQKLDYTAMQQCYADHAVFQDPVFGLLHGTEVKAMWEMLCRNAKDFSLTFSAIQAVDTDYHSCRWQAVYTFSTGRTVINSIQAYIKIENGKITEHSDYFSFWKWSRQALGLSGWLLGWTGFFQKKVSSRARANLIKWMSRKEKV